MDHQPEQHITVEREQRAGDRASPAQVQQDKRTVEQLDHQLLHEEAANPPRSPVPLARP